jgi:hypothetical protein
VTLQELRLAAAIHARHLHPANVARFGSAYLRDRSERRHYRELSEAELRATRTSDTAFVLGSGSSVRDVAAGEWERIGRCNTISFSEFQRQSFVRADYHLVGEVADVGVADRAGALREYSRLLRENPLYAETVLVLQEGWLARDSNDLVGRRLLEPGTRVFRFRRVKRGVPAPPSERLADGLVHGWNTSFDCVNLALLLGFRRIVLVGVDMYDRHYFWLEPGELRPNVDTPVDEPFPTSRDVIELYRSWRALLEPRGVELSVYNPRSLLAEALEVFRW